MRKWSFRILKTLAAILILITLLLLLLHTPWAQRTITRYTERYLQNKLHTTVRIEQLRFRLPYDLKLAGVYLEDQRGDTLLYSQQLRLRMNLPGLLRNRVAVRELDIDNAFINLHRDGAEADFNFSYIVRAFSGGTPTGESTAYSLQHLSFTNVRFCLRDDNAGYSTALQAGQFAAKLSAFDPSRLRFHFIESSLQHTGIEITSYAATIPRDTTVVLVPADTMDIAPGQMHIRQSAFSYRDLRDGSATSLSLGDVQLRAATLSLDRSLVVADSVQAHQVAVQVLLPEKQDSVRTGSSGSGWQILVSNGRFTESRFSLDDPRKAVRAKGLDMNHLDLQQIQLAAKNFIYNDTLISAAVSQLNFTERSGFRLDSLRTDFAWSATGIAARHLHLRTPNTQIDGEAADNSLSVLPSRIAMSDVLLLFPQLEQYPALGRQRQNFVLAQAQLRRDGDTYRIANSSLAGLNGTSIHFSGAVKPDADDTWFDIEVAGAKATASDVRPWLPASLLKQLQLPSYFNLKGKFSGTAAALYTNSQLSTDKGTIALKGSMQHLPAGIKSATYDMQVAVRALQTSYLLNKPYLPLTVSGTLQSKGKSLEWPGMQANITGSLDALNIGGYNYQNISLAALLNNGNITGNWSVDDEHLKMNGNARLFTDSGLYARIYIDTMNPAALKLYPGLNGIKGNVELEMDNIYPAQFSGKATIHSLALSRDSLHYAADNIYLNTNVANGQRHTHMQSEFADISLSTGPDPVKSTKDFLARLKAYFSDQLPAQQCGPVEVLAVLQPHPFLNNLMPGYAISDTARIDITYDSTQESALAGNIKVGQLTAGNIKIAGADILVSGQQHELQASANVKELTIKDQPVAKLSMLLNASGGKGVLVADAQQRSGGQPWFRAGLNITDSAGAYRIHIYPGSLVANYLPLATNGQHSIWINSKGIIINDLQLTNNNQQVQLNSDTLAADAPLHINIKNLQLKTLLQALAQDTTIASGIINAHSLVSGYMDTSLHYEGDLTVNDLKLGEQPAGNLSLSLTNSNNGLLLINGLLAGQGVNMTASGQYNLQQSVNPLYLDLHIDSLPAKLAQDLGGEAIDSARGMLRGRLNVQGTALQPVINGELVTDGIGFRVPATNARYTVSQDTLVFSGRQLLIHSLQLTDPQGQQATISGNVAYGKSLSDLTADIRLKAEKFEVLNSSAATTVPIYGAAFLKADMRLSGDMLRPAFTGSAQLNGNSKVTYIMRKEQQLATENDQLVTYMNLQNPAEKARLLADLRNGHTSDTHALKPGGAASYLSNIAMQLSSDPKAAVTIVLDEVNGDQLSLKGDAQLFTGATPEGKLTLNGVYHVAEGTYDFSYQQLLKRKFKIDKNSTITWAGDPERAQLDIRARYEVKASPYGLMENVPAAASDLEAYRPAMPFEVLLDIKGNFSRMHISFNIIPKEDNQQTSRDILSNINTRLAQLRNDTAELTKQSFSLLLLSQFVTNRGSDLFANVSPGNIVLGSVSQLLAKQLNLLAADVLKRTHTILSINPYADYLSSQNKLHTGVSVALTQKMIKDRLEVSLARNFELSGYSQTSSQLLDNINANYKLTRDGRFRLRAYRRNAQEVMLEGYVVETGVSFTITMEYQRFADLFKAKKERKKRK
ncbi:translocation/assembly module TamB domain-containing protein [uncultured Chitinophaga sp.]|uniref:translocation/assembly module TamB domain-containing protein n=1 Tax=uncultured Chitinophaga sp. TaxID=339340 RepID=UPI0025CD258B|nr:translocation/assembly module TamB domain-containing protein [uncultured Chitinophaga sp.]